MTTESANEAHGTPFARKFQDAVTLIEYDGQPVVVARDLGAFLGYAEDGKALVDLVQQKWSDEYIGNVDYIFLQNGRLAAFKKICAELGLALVDKRAPSLLLLTTSGIQLVLARTEKPEGKTFRRWLVSEVIPAYQATKALPGPAPVPELAGDVPSAPLPTAPPPAGPPSPPAHEAPAEVRMLRSMLDGLRAAGQINKAVWLPLDIALRQVEALPNPLEGLNALPITGKVPDQDEGDSLERKVIINRIACAFIHLSGADLERLDQWLGTCPKVFRRGALHLVRGGGAS